MNSARPIFSCLQGNQPDRPCHPTIRAVALRFALQGGLAVAAELDRHEWTSLDRLMKHGHQPDVTMHALPSAH